MERRTFLKASLTSLAAAACARAWGLPRQLGGHATLGAGNDGEGTARIVSPDYVVAGEPTPFTIEVVTGPSGIPTGGGITIGVHHAAWWQPRLQADRPDAPAYVEAIGPDGSPIALEYHEWMPHDMLANPGQGLWNDGIYHMAFIARITDAPLAPGAKVAFRFGHGPGGGALHQIADPNHQFRVMTDVDGNGMYRGILESPTFDIVAGPADRLMGFCPAQVRIGEPFTLQVQAEDAHFNVVRDSQGRASFSGRVDVHDEDGALLAEGVPIENGIGRAQITLDAPGPRRLRLSGEGLTGRATPCKAFEELPEHRIYWGDIHGHTGISDGLGDSCAEYFAYGRDVARLDVCALTDHGHFDWPQTQEAVRAFYAPGSYVTLLAQEAGARSDHVNYYFRTDDAPHVERWTTDYADLQDLILNQYNAGEEPQVIAGPHHFSYARGDDRYPFGVWDDRVMRFVEVYSSHGTSEYPENPRPVNGPTAMDSKFMDYGLAQGLRFGVIGASDNHDSRPGHTIWGHYPGGLAGFLAPELTREAIWQSLWNRRTYGTSLDRIYVEFTVNGAVMGSEIEADGPVRVVYEVIGQTDGVTVELVRDGAVIRSDETDDGMVRVEAEDTPDSANTWYYLRVLQDNGERAWTTPIWVARA